MMINQICNIAWDSSQIGDAENLTIVFVGIFVVFFALLTLYQVFYFLPKILSIRIKRRPRTGETELESVSSDISGEVNAAIGLAFHLFMNETHDEESYISTIKRVERRYSPWSSKIYNVRNIFNRI